MIVEMRQMRHVPFSTADGAYLHSILAAKSPPAWGSIDRNPKGFHYSQVTDITGCSLIFPHGGSFWRML